MLANTKLNQSAFIIYKWFNSLFLGVSIGSVFTIYQPLKPSVYSLGGIFLAIFTMVIARYYHKILKAYYFFRISLLVELIVLLILLIFLVFSYSYSTALTVYIGYQLKAYSALLKEHIFKEDHILTKIDVAKQIGYLVGLAISFAFYKIAEYFQWLSNKEDQVYYIHFVLIAIELMVIYFLIKAFYKSNTIDI